MLFLLETTLHYVTIYYWGPTHSQRKEITCRHIDLELQISVVTLLSTFDSKRIPSTNKSKKWYNRPSLAFKHI